MTTNGQKCLKMSHSTCENERDDGFNVLEKALNEENANLLRLLQSRNEEFNRQIGTSKQKPALIHHEMTPHTKRWRRAPEYRRMNKYVKSVTQCKKQRSRRRCVLQLRKEGLSMLRIAQTLHVSERTVERDMKKTACYRIGQLHKVFRAMDDANKSRMAQELQGKSLVQQFQYLTNLIASAKNQFRIREYQRHMFKVIIDMDDITNGCPALHTWPNSTTLTYPMYFNFYVKHAGTETFMGAIQTNKK